MPISKRTGKRYAAGSHQSLAGFPRVCFGCGEKVTLKHDHVWQETLEPSQEKRTWHMRCRLAVIGGRIEAQKAAL